MVKRKWWKRGAKFLLITVLMTGTIAAALDLDVLGEKSTSLEVSKKTARFYLQIIKDTEDRIDKANALYGTDRKSDTYCDLIDIDQNGTAELFLYDEVGDGVSGIPGMNLTIASEKEVIFSIEGQAIYDERFVIAPPYIMSVRGEKGAHIGMPQETDARDARLHLMRDGKLQEVSRRFVDTSEMSHEGFFYWGFYYGDLDEYNPKKITLSFTDKTGEGHSYSGLYEELLQIPLPGYTSDELLEQLKDDTLKFGVPAYEAFSNKHFSYEPEFSIDAAKNHLKRIIK